MLEQRRTWPVTMNFVSIYRCVWALSNVLLIIFAVIQWAHLDHHTISIDLANIQKQTGLIKGDTQAGIDLRAIFGFKKADKDFCEWLASPGFTLPGENETETATPLNAPFDKFNCEKTKFSLNNFAKVGIAKNKHEPKKNVWELYTEAELLAPGTKMKTPNATALDDYLDNNAIYTGPTECKKEVTSRFNGQLKLVIPAIVLLLAHIVFVYAYSMDSLKDYKMVMTVGLICISIFVYIVAIIVYIEQSNSKLFDECSWMSTSFQTNYVMLYDWRIAYLVLAIFGIFFTVVFAVLEAFVKNGDYQSLADPDPSAIGKAAGLQPPFSA